MMITQTNISFLYEDCMLEIWVPGCLNYCEGCQNPELWSFNAGKETKYTEVLKQIKKKEKYIDGVVLTGGDPLWSPVEVYILINLIKDEYPKFKIWLYTGFSIEEIDEDKKLKDIFNLCDVVVTDRFKKELPSTNLTGSNNQRIWRKK